MQNSPIFYRCVSLDDLSKEKFSSVNKYAEPKQSVHSKPPVTEWTYCQKVVLKRLFASSFCRVWRFGSGLQLQRGRGRGAGLHPVRRRPHGRWRSVWHGDSGTGQVRSQSESVVHACMRTFSAACLSSLQSLPSLASVSLCVNQHFSLHLCTFLISRTETSQRLRLKSSGFFFFVVVAVRLYPLVPRDRKSVV